MTSTQLAILRTIGTRQPVMKDDLYRSISEYAPHTLANYLSELQDMGYIGCDRRKGPVWLTVRGRDKVDEA